MHSISSTHPLLLLHELESHYKIAAPKQAEKTSNTLLWTGVGFRLANLNLCISSRSISEITDSNFKKNLTKVPGTKNWVYGMISLHGQPLPIIDLNNYLFSSKTEITGNTRLIVIKIKNGITGLLADAVSGLKQFHTLNDLYHNEVDNYPAQIKPFIAKKFVKDDLIWGEFSVTKLEAKSEFLNASRH